jgi:hypothetical protein
MPIAGQYGPCSIGIFEIIGDEPFKFGGFAQFGESFDWIIHGGLIMSTKITLQY